MKVAVTYENGEVSSIFWKDTTEDSIYCYFCKEKTLHFNLGRPSRSDFKLRRIICWVLQIIMMDLRTKRLVCCEM